LTKFVSNRLEFNKKSSCLFSFFCHNPTGVNLIHDISWNVNVSTVSSVYLVQVYREVLFVVACCYFAYSVCHAVAYI